MIEKNIEQITEEDLQDLIDNVISEGKKIEYKRSLSIISDSGKKEFLADVSSFANASGGDLIYGITESGGTPKKLEGLTLEDVDLEISRLENILRDGIEPRIPAVEIKSIGLSNSRTALIIRVPKSWISPHRVSFKGHDKFYARNSNGKYPLDVAELRVAFNLSETITERIRSFRQGRILNLFANETPVPFYDNPKIVLHLIPIISFNPAQSYDISKISSHPEKMKPIYCSGSNHRYNLDGFLTYSGGREDKSHTYVQLFRNGIIEAVEGQLLESSSGELLIHSVEYERQLIRSLPDYLSVLETLNVDPPTFIFLTLLGVKGYSMNVVERIYGSRRAHTIDRDILLLPEIVIESYRDNAERILRPCFDSIWNACGFRGSLNYNEAGEWTPPR